MSLLLLHVLPQTNINTRKFRVCFREMTSRKSNLVNKAKRTNQLEAETIASDFIKTEWLTRNKERIATQLHATNGKQ